jgi:hypothetical protein
MLSGLTPLPKFHHYFNDVDWANDFSDFINHGVTDWCTERVIKLESDDFEVWYKNHQHNVEQHRIAVLYQDFEKRVMLSYKFLDNIIKEFVAFNTTMREIYGVMMGYQIYYSDKTKMTVRYYITNHSRYLSPFHQIEDNK